MFILKFDYNHNLSADFQGAIMLKDCEKEKAINAYESIKDIVYYAILEKTSRYGNETIRDSFTEF